MDIEEGRSQMDAGRVFILGISSCQEVSISNAHFMSVLFINISFNAPQKLINLSRHGVSPRCKQVEECGSFNHIQNPFYSRLPA
jgi:hypothetical protein